MSIPPAQPRLRPRHVTTPPLFIGQDPTRTTSANNPTMQWRVVVPPAPCRPPVQTPGPAGTPDQPTARALTFSTTSLSAASQIVAVLAIGLGLSFPEGGQMGWLAHSAWSVFAITATLLQLASLFGGVPAQLWAVQVAATTALLVHFVLVVAPMAATNTGFLLTLGTSAAVLGCWFSPVRPIRGPKTD